MYELAEKVPRDEAIVELGSFEGKSTCYLAAGSRGSLVYAIDLWALNKNPRFKRSGVGFRRNIEHMGFSGIVKATRGKSAEIGRRWEEGPVGLLYIDGCHKTTAVIDDYAAWQRHLAPGASVAFHDFHMKRVRDAIEALGFMGKGRRVNRLYVLEDVQ